jgi:hypothetical protein
VVVVVVVVVVGALVVVVVEVVDVGALVVVVVVVLEVVVVGAFVVVVVVAPVVTPWSKARIWLMSCSTTQLRYAWSGAHKTDKLAVAVRVCSFQTNGEPFQPETMNAFGCAVPNAVRPGLPATIPGIPNLVA